MKDYKKRIERLLNIILSINGECGLEIKQIADKYCISKRTVYRDIDTLLESGVSIYKSGNKYFLDKNYFRKFF